MKISQYLPLEAIVPDLPASNKMEALRAMLCAMEELGYVKDASGAEQDVLAREAKMTTGVGHGIAVPHARTSTANGLCAVLARHRDGLDWASLDGNPVHFIVMALSPHNAPGPHLQFVAAMARLLNDEQVQKGLLAAGTARRMYDILCPQKRKSLFRP